MLRSVSDRGEAPSFRDNENSRFFAAQGLSPEATWSALTDRLGVMLGDARDAFLSRPLTMDPERVRWWHGAIFSGLFPYDGGTFRAAHEPAFYGVSTDAGIRQLEGAASGDIQRELRDVCDEFDRAVQAFGDIDSATVLDRCRAVADLYAGILRVHPFVDGNHRAAFVAMSAALWSLGLPNVAFDSDAEMLAHDAALASSLLPEDGSSEPFAQLLAERISSADAA
jgi:prophage maintenance system killer protein